MNKMGNFAVHANALAYGKNETGVAPDAAILSSGYIGTGAGVGNRLGNCFSI